MEIRFDCGYTLTTDHPASHYGLGVLVDNGDGVYGPADLLPVAERCKEIFGADVRLLAAADIICMQATVRLWTDEEIALMQRYLSQMPKPNRRTLPDEMQLRRLQVLAERKTLYGDRPNGIMHADERLLHATLAVRLQTATTGRLHLHDYTGGDVSWQIERAKA